MLILIGIVPAFFALDMNMQTEKLNKPLSQVESIIHVLDTSGLSASDRRKVTGIIAMQKELKSHFLNTSSLSQVAKEKRFEVRKNILVVDRDIKALMKQEDVRFSEVDREILTDNMKVIRKATDYSPIWVILIISTSLGIGTMIGWKRIVKTIGEKIGKEHLTYAQGASAEFVAASTIGLSSFWGWPVSTTQILSSSVAGSMVASKGVKNLQPATVRNILLTWALTLPVVVVLSGTLFLLFRSIF